MGLTLQPELKERAVPLAETSGARGWRWKIISRLGKQQWEQMQGVEVDFCSKMKFGYKLETEGVGFYLLGAKCTIAQ